MTQVSRRVASRFAGVCVLAALFAVWWAPGDAGGASGDVFVAKELPKAIPDDDPDGVSSTIFVGLTGQVTDLDLGLQISHTHVGDLWVTLTHTEPKLVGAEILESITLLVRRVGCGSDDIDVVFDDEVIQSVDDACTSPPPALGGLLRPSNPLSAFDGESALGYWTLTVSDSAVLDVGTLTGWSLHVDVANIALGKRVVRTSSDIACEDLLTDYFDSALISLGDEVTWCIWIRNSGSVDLKGLTVVDDQLDNLPGPGDAFILEPGGVLVLGVSDSPGHSFTNTATVTAHDDSETFVVSASDTATVIVNEDRFLDAVFANGADSTICLGTGAALFDCITINNDPSFGVALGDMNGDGFLDAVNANEYLRNRVCLSGARFGFFCEDVGFTGRRSLGVALGDVDGDGDLDAVFSNSEEPNDVCLGDGSGRFFDCTDVSSGTNWTTDVELGDVDGDGDLDAVFANAGQRNRVCLGFGDGSFLCGEISGDAYLATGVALGDVNGDGDLDAVFSNTLQRNRVCLGAGTGLFDCADVSSDINVTQDVALGDVDGDGDLDAMFANSGQRNRLCLGDGGGGFFCGDVTSGTNLTLGVALGDVNGDYMVDAVFANLDQRNRVCLGAGTGLFDCADVSTVANSTRGVALAHSGSGMVGLVEPNGRWHLRRDDGSDYSFWYGVSGDVPLFGDWDGDGYDTPGMYRPTNGFVYLTNDLPPDGQVGVGDPALTFFYGAAGDQVFVGDWDGNGTDTLGISRNGKIFLVDTNATVVAGREFWFGTPTDMPFGGDPDGDGSDSVFLYRPSSGFTYYTNSTPVGPNAVAPTDGTLFFGVPTDRFVIGDWDKDDVDSVGVFRPGTTTVFLRNTNTTGPADITYPYGQNTWTPIAGHWY